MANKELNYIRWCMEGNSTFHKWVSVESSNLDQVMWIEKGRSSPWGALCVKFKTKGNKPPVAYIYTRVSEETYNEMLRADSIGKYFIENIRDSKAYPAYKIEQ